MFLKIKDFLGRVGELSFAKKKGNRKELRGVSLCFRGVSQRKKGFVGAVYKLS